ncbi:MAG TPA: leucine--tRNA ligase [Candidatus Saccharimonadales bacterium]|nr:leucine--tRNA ligase [Candidatus Saccharimonadales bacterium]
MKRYNPKEIEPRWQQYWDDNKTYQADLWSAKPKYIAMSMFNYPSGAGIHIGHAMNYTISDVLARFKRQNGYESYHPVGWDAFGLPAENYAIKTGVSPQESMATIIPNYHKQYRAMGWSNDWSKEISTHQPEYYRWTQWIFSEMYRAGLAYQDSRLQWWCDKCQTVLANEQIDANGKCWRHDSADDPVVKQREVKQWFFKITEYADELLEATDDLEWTESVKLAQKNWIGRSKGSKVKFTLEGLGATDDHLEVFTTAHDTIYGVTFLVIAPEHPIVRTYAQLADNALDIDDYVAEATHKSDVERAASKHKTGVPIEGLSAVHPLTGASIPVWIADYVLSGYGTGAIMAVPGEDERDYEFAQKFSLPIIYTTEQQEFISYTDTIKPKRNKFVLANSAEFDGLSFAAGRKKILQKLQEVGAGQHVTLYKMRDWSVSRQRYWGAPIPIIHCADHGPVLVPDNQLPVILPEIKDFQPSGDGRSALARATDWLKAPCPTCGKEGERETDTLDTYICSSWYMLRYLDPDNESNIFDSTVVNKWTPIDFYNGADHATAHMLYARFVTRFFHKKGLIANPEPFKKFLFNGKVTAADGQMFSKSKGNGVDPLAIIDDGYGADALRTYLMFASPLEQWTKWDPQGVPGAYRFLSRLWALVQDFAVTDGAQNVEPHAALLQSVHKTIKKVTEDIDQQKYNTAIAAMMQAVNELYLVKQADSFTHTDSWRFALESMTMLVAPFGPHIAEELWHTLGHDDSVHIGHWPKWDEAYLVSDTITIAVQVNGKVRSQVSVPSDSDEAAVVAAAKADPKVAGYIEGKEIKKSIYVPKKLVSFVV